MRDTYRERERERERERDKIYNIIIIIFQFISFDNATVDIHDVRESDGEDEETPIKIIASSGDANTEKEFEPFPHIKYEGLNKS